MSDAPSLTHSPRVVPAGRARVLVGAALAIVYVVWGSTYLAIGEMVDTVPPMFATASRFLLAGVLLAGWVMARGGVARMRVGWVPARNAAIVGLLLLVGGTSLVGVAEQHVATGLTALIVAAVPLIVVLLRRITGERVPSTSLVGIVTGFAGMGLLVAPHLDAPSTLRGIGIVLAASTLWSCGSFASSRLAMPGDGTVSTLLQVVTGGVACLLLGLVRGEPAHLHAGSWTPHALVALGYLVVFGSLIAFSAFTWLLQNAPISTVATYAYVNPIVALVLGWSLRDEHVSAMTLVAAAVIVGSVALTVRGERPDR